jgi:acetyl esterase/lipase
MVTMSKYNINKEFFPYSHIAPLIQNAKIAGWMGSMMKPPKWLFKDKSIQVTKKLIDGFNNNPIEILIIEPKNIETTNCLVYYHGGGFFFGAAGYHYKLAKEYVLNTPCKIIFVQYRLAPKHPFPIPVYDSYNALCWTFNNKENLCVDKIAVGGDSAGGAIAAAVCQMARDFNTTPPLFQLLIYPVTDHKMETESNIKYTSTPMWNSKLSKKMWDGYLPNKDVENIAYASPMNALTFNNLPKAYIETAEYDCLRDEAINYAKALMNANIDIALNETNGTMHGYDIVFKAETTKKSINNRIEYMKIKFNEPCK